MNFVVDDLLDFAQLNNDKFRKNIKEFDLREAVEEVLSIQQEKAIMQGLTLKCSYRPQTIDGTNCYSFFNQAVAVADNSYVEQTGGELCNHKAQKTEAHQSSPILVSSDKRRIQQCLINLQSNSLKFTDEGGKITIYFTLYRRGDKSYAEFQIKDTGYGIANSDKSKLFQLFGFVQSTQDVNTRGIGLGLSISQKIVKKFGGEIGFKSEEGVGSTFGFTIELDSYVEDQSVDQKVKKV